MSDVASELLTLLGRTTVALAAAFDRQARQKGAHQTLVVVFTSPSAEFQYEAKGTWAQEPLVTALRNSGLRTLDLGPIFNRRLNGKSICTVMRYPDRCDGHYNEVGYAMVAESVAADIVTDTASASAT